MKRLATAAIAATLLAPALAGPGLAAGWYERGHGRPPVGNRIYVCHGYTCRIVSPVALTGADIAEIAAPFAAELPDATAERDAISRSVQAFERIVGARIGTSRDLAEMQFGGGSDDQMDCIDEATNTTSLLTWLKEQGYLRHHKVREPRARGFFLDGRYPHATAVIAEEQGGALWAIDSWPRANAEPPVVQPLAAWFRSRSAVPAG
jgi:hypothetical protein